MSTTRVSRSAVEDVATTMSAFYCALLTQFNQFTINTFATNDVGIRRGRGHLEGQTIGPLEGVAVPDEESSWLLVFQNSNG